MKRFYLFCDAGMSTSLMASKMQKCADANNLPIEVKAFGTARMHEIVSQYNPEAILLGPQVKHHFEKVNEQYGADHVVYVINQSDYGTMNGERVLKRVLMLYKEKNK